MLLQIRDEETGSPALTDEEIRDEVVTMLIAGHETTAHALTWTWYLLSQHPEAEEKMHAELDAVLRAQLPAVDDLDLLPYNRMVLSEAIRLYPPVWIVARRNPTVWSVGNYRFPPGSFIFISQYLMQHDPRFFPDPECLTLIVGHLRRLRNAQNIPTSHSVAGHANVLVKALPGSLDF